MTPGTARRVKFAHGYTGLGMFKQAQAELDAIGLGEQALPPVLLARLELSWEAKQWESVILDARRLVERAPEEERGWIGWAFALRELGHIAEAKAVLLRAEPLHGAASAVLHYNLACYHCLLGELPEARVRLKTAVRMHPPFKDEAPNDPDFGAMSHELMP